MSHAALLKGTASHVCYILFILLAPLARATDLATPLFSLPELAEQQHATSTLPLSLDPVNLDAYNPLSISQKTNEYGTIDFSATSYQDAIDTDDHDPVEGRLFMVRQTGMVRNYNWIIENNIGDQYSNTNSLVSSNYRVSLPKSVMRGISGAAANHRTQINWTLGQTGNIGKDDGAFTSNDNSLLGIGMNYGLASNWQTGAQLWQVNNKEGEHQQNLGGVLRYSSDDNASYSLHTLIDKEHHQGVWLNSDIKTGDTRHRYGLFRLGPDLTWTDKALLNDRQGAYWHTAITSQQWKFSNGLEAEQTNIHHVSNREGILITRLFNKATRDITPSTSFTGQFRTEHHDRYAFFSGNRKTSLQFDLSLKKHLHPGSAQFFLSWLDTMHPESKESTLRLGWEQEWRIISRNVLRSRIDIKQTYNNGSAQFIPMAGLSLRHALSHRTTLSGSAYYVADLQNATSGMSPRHWCTIQPDCKHGSGGSLWIGLNTSL